MQIYLRNTRGHCNLALFGETIEYVQKVNRAGFEREIKGQQKQQNREPDVIFCPCISMLMENLEGNSRREIFT